MDCIECGTKITTKNAIKYCSNSCQALYQNKRKFEAFARGEYIGKQMNFQSGRWCKELVLEANRRQCAFCNTAECYNGKPLVLEVNHIDGDALNNCFENIEILCPNCHSQTDTFRAKNKGNGTRKRS